MRITLEKVLGMLVMVGIASCPRTTSAPPIYSPSASKAMQGDPNLRPAEPEWVELKEQSAISKVYLAGGDRICRFNGRAYLSPSHDPLRQVEIIGSNMVGFDLLQECISYPYQMSMAPRR